MSRNFFADRDENNISPFELLFRLFYEKTYRAAFVIVQDRHLADDAVQEAFIQAFKNMGQVRDHNKVGAWLAVIAMNQAKKLRKKTNRSLPMGEIELPCPSTKNEASLAEDRIIIHQLFHQMKPEDRQILVLKYFYELPDKEIAILLKIAPGTVKSRLNRLRVRCKLMLAGTGSRVRNPSGVRGSGGI